MCNAMRRARNISRRFVGCVQVGRLCENCPVIDLRSDTASRPTKGMRRAIANAQVGDEQKREDPTVLALEERVAELVGHDEALFLPTATMANQIALRLLSEPGDEVIAEANAHVFRFELGGPAVHAGLAMKPIAADDGRFTPAQLREALAPPDIHAAVTKVVCVENTHNAGGGRVWSPEQLDELAEEARARDLRLHLDGARLWNAAIATQLPLDRFCRQFDTVTLCLSKGLGCPMGALLATSSIRAARARRFKHLFGGAMRQSGIVAAAGVYALDNHLDRLADDHANARYLGEHLVEAGLPVDQDQIETNFVLIRVGEMGLAVSEALGRLEQNGVLLSPSARRETLRAVTHLDVDRGDIEQAATAICGALAASYETSEAATGES